MESKNLCDLENRMNVHYHELQEEYTVVSTANIEIKKKMQAVQTSVDRDSEELASLREKLRTLRTGIEEHGLNVTNAAPLKHMKQAFQVINKEIEALGVNIGLMSQQLWSKTSSETIGPEIDNQYDDEDI